MSDPFRRRVVPMHGGEVVHATAKSGDIKVLPEGIYNSTKEHIARVSLLYMYIGAIYPGAYRFIITFILIYLRLCCCRVQHPQGNKFEWRQANFNGVQNVPIPIFGQKPGRQKMDPFSRFLRFRMYVVFNGKPPPASYFFPYLSFFDKQIWMKSTEAIKKGFMYRYEKKKMGETEIRWRYIQTVNWDGINDPTLFYYYFFFAQKDKTSAVWPLNLLRPESNISEPGRRDLILSVEIFLGVMAWCRVYNGATATAEAGQRFCSSIVNPADEWKEWKRANKKGRDVG